jgi:uncharacterized membrane protein
MSETVSSGTAAPPSSDDRNLAFLVYALLFFGPFLAGLSGLVGVVIAYVRRSVADPVERSHFAFQIREFWIAVVLMAVAGLSALVGVGGVISDLIEAATNQGRGWDAWDVAALGREDLHIQAAWIMAVIGGALIGAVASLWVMAASVFGAVRLAGHQPIGRVRA